MLHITFDQVNEDSEDILCLLLHDNLQTRNISEEDYTKVQGMAYWIEQDVPNC